MGGSGTGGWEMLSRQLAQTQRRLDQWAYKREATRAALKDARLRQADQDEYPSDRVDFPCFHFCIECRFITENAMEHCPSCGHRSLIDLAPEGWAEEVGFMDDSRRADLRQRLKSFVYLGVAFFIFSVMFLFPFLFVFPHDLFEYSILEGVVVLMFIGVFQFAISAGVALPVYTILLDPISRLIRWLRPLPPARWRLPVGLKARKPSFAEAVRGAVVPTKDEIIAPISGEACVAYRVRAELLAPSSRRVVESLLDESWGVDCCIGPADIRGEAVLLDLPTQLTHEVGSDGINENIDMFLRKRAIDPSVGTIMLHESILRPDDEVRMDSTIDGSVAVITSS